MNDARVLNAKMERVELLIAALEGCAVPSVREQARELMATLLEFHEAALTRILARLPEGERAALGQDPLAGGLLLLYGLHPDGLEERIEAALEKVRPNLRAHKGDVELLGIDGDAVRLRLKGTCHGCPSSATTFKALIDAAIRDRAPEIEVIHVEGVAP